MRKSLIIATLLFVAIPVLAHAASKPKADAVKASVYLEQNVAGVATIAKQAIIVEAQTAEVLYAKQADKVMPTSSMSKVLTMYVVFEAIKSGKLKLDDVVVVSRNAWKQKGSRMFIRDREKVKVEDLIRGVIVQSGNDAAVALAEAVSGNEEAFVGEMNEVARKLGMARSHFANATGLPDPNHYSTAQDLAKLAIALLQNHSESYHYYSEKSFTHNKIKQGNRNPLLYRDMGVDGIKTGHTEAAGYGLIGSSLRDGRRIITIVNGLKSKQERADEPAKLIEWAYREYGLYRLLKSQDSVGEAKIWLGESDKISVAAAHDLVKSLPRSIVDKAEISLHIDSETEAPIQKGQQLGKVVIEIPGLDNIEVPLVSVQEVQRVGFIRMLWEKFKRLIGRA